MCKTIISLSQFCKTPEQHHKLMTTNVSRNHICGDEFKVDAVAEAIPDFVNQL
jgi:hypothetical protein